MKKLQSFADLAVNDFHAAKISGGIASGGTSDNTPASTHIGNGEYTDDSTCDACSDVGGYDTGNDQQAADATSGSGSHS